jgi:hypothetical protein
MVDHILRQAIFGGTLLLMAVTIGICAWTNQLQGEVEHNAYNDPMPWFVQHYGHLGVASNQSGSSQTR